MNWDWLFLGLCIILLLSVADLEGFPKMAMADLQKLIDNMKRAQAITDRAAADAIKHSAIMNSFEQRLTLNEENMTKIEDYDKLMAQMDDMSSNGGPALETTFPASTAVTPPPLPTGTPAVNTNVNAGTALFDAASGKQL